MRRPRTTSKLDRQRGRPSDAPDVEKKMTAEFDAAS
jgi:hypothetical protein